MASILWPAGGRPDNPGIKTMTINAIVAAANPIRWILTRLLGACTATAPGDIASVFFAYDATRRIAAYVRCRTVA